MPEGLPQQERSRHPKRTTERDAIEMQYYNNPALDAELAYRRELAMLAGKGTRSPRQHRRWFRRSR
jgi:hypothetical protein